MATLAQRGAQRGHPWRPAAAALADTRAAVGRVVPTTNASGTMRTAVLPILLLVSALLTGCSPKLVAPEGYPSLYVSPDNDDVLGVAMRGLDLRNYRKIHLEPTQVRLPGDAAASVADAQELAAYVDAKLRENLAGAFELVDAPADDALRIRFSVVDAEPTKKAQLIMLVPPFATVNMVSPKGAFTGSVTLGGEFFEGRSTEASAAFVAYGSRPGIDATVAFRKWDAAKRVIDRTSVKLARDLEALRQAE